MGISLSGGPWQYNRFSSLDEGSKPDYLDFDKDGNKEEPMKKALKEKGKKPCPKCEDKESPCECHKTVKEWVESLLEEGYDLSEYSWDEMVEMFDEGFKPLPQARMDRQINKSQRKEDAAAEKGDNKEANKQMQRRLAMKDPKSRKIALMKKEDVEYVEEDSRRTSNKQHTKRVRSNIKSFGSDYTPPKNYDPDANRGKGEVLTPKQVEKKRRKALRQEEVESYLVNEGFASNPVSAEVLFNHMSQEWLEAIEKSLG